MKTTPIYKFHNQYLLSRDTLFQKVKNKIDEYFLINLQTSVELEGDFRFESLETDIANVHQIGAISIPVQDFMIVDKEHQSIDTNAQILINLQLSIQEGIEGGEV